VQVVAQDEIPRRPSTESDDPVTTYARRVVSGAVVAGPHVRNQCQRHLDDLAREDLWFDLEACYRALNFFPDMLRLSEGQFDGIPFHLHESQEFIVGSLFGWKRGYRMGYVARLEALIERINGELQDLFKVENPDDSQLSEEAHLDRLLTHLKMKLDKELEQPRRFTRAYIEQGKGNGKSPMVGGIGLYLLCADGEAGSQVYAAGATKDQASILFQDAVKMVQQSEELAENIHQLGQNPVYQLTHIKSQSFFKPISREAKKTGSGPRPHGALCDEIHEHPDRGVIEILERGFKFRRQPLLLMITNSGTDRNSICYEEHTHAIRVAAGDADDDSTFTYVCALDEDDDPLNDETCWAKVNPLLNVTITYDYLRKVAKQARDMPGKANTILRLHFCVWTDSHSAWITTTLWEAVEDPEMKLEDFVGRRCWAGLDLSATKDITGLSLLFEDGEDSDGEPRFALFARGYTPKDTLLKREEEDKAPYSVWVEGGFLIATPGPVVRFDYLIHDLVAWQSEFDIEFVAYDKFLMRTFEEKCDELNAALPLVEHPQGFNHRKSTPLFMPDSIDMFETLIMEKRIRIEVNPALRSAVAGATFVESPAGLKRFAKQKATQRIDLCVSSAQAIGAATTEEEQDPKKPVTRHGADYTVG
jgi:phage terminase large subunit-like protein